MPDSILHEQYRPACGVEERLSVTFDALNKAFLGGKRVPLLFPGGCIWWVESYAS